jgi:hypothetical protein
MAPSPLIVLMKQIGVNQVNVDGLPTYISSTAGGVQSVSQIVELPHVEHVGKSRFSILGRLGLAYRFICARRRWRRWARRRLGRNGTFRREPTKLRGSNWHAADVDRSERDRKRFQGSADTAAAHIRPDGSAVQVIADSRVD